MQILNHAPPIKLDNNNYIWRTRMENVVFANGFEDHIEGLKVYPPKVEAQMVAGIKDLMTTNHSAMQLCEKFGHTVVSCYHRFDINFQGYNPKSDSTQVNKSNHNNQMQAMLASPSTINYEAWFFDTGATHHLSQDVDPLSDVQPYKGNEKVIVGNGMQIPILHTGAKFFPSPLKSLSVKKSLSCP
uniref:Retrovirus-related Pol polyprotein from transposon RE2 n=1 Tax=Vitis vinifera TaxID=29760 RepID=A5BW91_VITVI|nr:hypothetical protein VITISV_010747 [Vitis vinifera]